MGELAIEQININTYNYRVEQYLHDRHYNPNMVAGSTGFYGAISCLNETKLNSSNTKIYMDKWRRRGGAGFAHPALGRKGGVAILFHSKLKVHNGMGDRGEDPNNIYDNTSGKVVGERVEVPAALTHRLMAVRFNYSDIQILLVSFYAPVAATNKQGEGSGRESSNDTKGFFKCMGEWLASARSPGDELWLCGDKNCTPEGERLERRSVQSQWPATFHAGHDELADCVVTPNDLTDIYSAREQPAPHTCFY